MNSIDEDRPLWFCSEQKEPGTREITVDILSILLRDVLMNWNRHLRGMEEKFCLLRNLFGVSIWPNTRWIPGLRYRG